MFDMPAVNYHDVVGPGPAAGVAAAFHSPANASAGCAQIRALLAPKSCRRFIAEHWETSPHVVRGAALHSEAGAGLGFGGGLLRVADLARLARHWEFKVAADHAQVRMIPENSFSHDEAGCRQRTVDAPSFSAACMRLTSPGADAPTMSRRLTFTTQTKSSDASSTAAEGAACDALAWTLGILRKRTKTS